MQRIRTIGSATAIAGLLMVSHLFLRLKPLPGRGKSCCVIALSRHAWANPASRAKWPKGLLCGSEITLLSEGHTVLHPSAAAGQQLMRHRS